MYRAYFGVILYELVIVGVVLFFSFFPVRKIVSSFYLMYAAYLFLLSFAAILFSISFIPIAIALLYYIYDKKKEIDSNG